MKKSDLIRIIKEEIADVIKEAETVTTKQFDGPGPKPIDIVRSAIEKSITGNEYGTVKQKADILYQGRLPGEKVIDGLKSNRGQIVLDILKRYAQGDENIQAQLDNLTDKQINDSLNQLSVGGSIVPPGFD